MAVIAVAPLVLKNVTLSVGTDNYEAHVSGVTFTPSASQINWTGLNGNTIADTSTATWVVQLDYAQDWTTTNSLSRYLLANEGLSKAVTFKPQAAGTPSFAATVVITPGAIGGSVNAVSTASVTLGSTRPVLTP